LGAAIEPGEGLVDARDRPPRRLNAEAGHLGADFAQRRHLFELVEPTDGDLGQVPGIAAVLERGVVDLS
jgi:hypothetical protein